jgi:ABC-2 type transport system ATP-binding protein
MSIILSTHLLKKVYPSSPPSLAVDEISFHMNEGEILGLLGPNGSGKTTTIQMLLGTLASTSGSIFYFGKDFYLHRSEILQKVTFASTYTSLPWLLTVAENLQVFGLLYGLNKEESNRAFDPLLERFGIMDKKRLRVSSLSAGQVTRLMIVKAFFTHPQIVLLDEPTASLDPDIANDICSFLIEQRDKAGVSILFTSHKMEEVMKICDRTIFLKGGKIIADDTPQNLAKKVSTFRIALVIADGMKRTTALAVERGLRYRQDHRQIEIWIEGEKIPSFLDSLCKSSISYSNITIEEPSLEDFFLQIVKSSHEL